MQHGSKNNKQNKQNLRNKRGASDAVLAAQLPGAAIAGACRSLLIQLSAGATTIVDPCRSLLIAPFRGATVLLRREDSLRVRHRWRGERPAVVGKDERRAGT
jgi:hypothetical protein